jgi:hypothetical protein
MEIKYNLGSYCKGEAYQKIDSFLDGLVKKHSDLVSNPKKKWNDNKDEMNFSFEVRGFDISGDIKLEEDKLVLEGKLPWVARLYSERIEEIINKQLDELFVKKSGDYFG